MNNTSYNDLKSSTSNNRSLDKDWGAYTTDADILLAHNRLCLIEKGAYVLCDYYCCGEFWESRYKFCCNHNFRPVRSTFFFLLSAFFILSLYTILYLTIEIIVKNFVLKNYLISDEDAQNAIAAFDDSSISALSGDDTVEEDRKEERLRMRMKQIIKKTFDQHQQQLQQTTGVGTASGAASVKQFLKGAASASPPTMMSVSTNNSDNKDQGIDGKTLNQRRASVLRGLRRSSKLMVKRWPPRRKAAP